MSNYVVTTLLACAVLAGCTPIDTLRIPLGDESSAAREPSPVVIDDLRPASARKLQSAGRLGRCERWYGDANYSPSKIDYLQQLLAERLPADGKMVLTLRRFDTVEFCGNSASRAGAAAASGARGALGDSIHVPDERVDGGDSVFIRLAGETNGVPFDVSRRFDYEDLHYNVVTGYPAANPEYRQRMIVAIRELADEIVTMSGRPR